MIRKILVWLFILTATFMYGQSECSIPGTYVLKEQIGIRVEPGVSHGDFHYLPYISHVDTTITSTIILDTLYNATFILDTLIGAGTVPSTIPTIKMYGKWNVQQDTLFIHYDSIDTVYNYAIYEVIVDYVDEYIILPDKKNDEYEPTKISITEQYRVLSFDNVRYLGTEENKVVDIFIDAIIPLNEERNWMKYRRK